MFVVHIYRSKKLFEITHVNFAISASKKQSQSVIKKGMKQSHGEEKIGAPLLTLILISNSFQSKIIR
jgi:hypothetical protein